MDGNILFELIFVIPIISYYKIAIYVNTCIFIIHYVQVKNNHVEYGVYVNILQITLITSFLVILACYIILVYQYYLAHPLYRYGELTYCFKLSKMIRWIYHFTQQRIYEKILFYTYDDGTVAWLICMSTFIVDYVMQSLFPCSVCKSNTKETCFNVTTYLRCCYSVF